jgi:hypothetical protein
MDYTVENELSKIILGCAIEVHKQLGPGLLESAYQSGTSKYTNEAHKRTPS